MRKTVIITGTSKGLGKALADKYLTNDDTLVIGLARSTAGEHKGHTRFHHIKLDLGTNRLEERLKQLSTLVRPGTSIVFISNVTNIHPIAFSGAFAEADIKNNAVVNMIAPIIICNYLIKVFRQHRIDFVNISSGAADRPIAGWSLYCSAKAMVKMFFKVMSEEYQDNPLYRFFSIDPGVIDTDMQSQIRASQFPSLAMFQKLEEQDLLKTPADAAREVINHIK